MLRLKHIYKKYDNTKNILNDINLILPSKGLISIVGVSGSGKSTLLNLIGGIDKPSKGKIFINNVEVTNFNKYELDWYHDKFVGFIFQHYNLIDYLTVEDNLKLVSNNYNYILKKLNIYYLRNKKVSLLSGGEKQRVAIARGVIKNPRILLCDEPTGALDVNSSNIIMNILKDLSKDRLVIVVTHNLDLANKYSNNILRMEDGHLLNSINNKDDRVKLHINKVKYKNIFKIIINHLLNKKKRNILISISFAIGLIALGLVLSISSGFKKSLDKEEKNSLSKYPIIISKTSNNIEDELNNNRNNDLDKIYSYDINHVNNITIDYVDKLNVINNNLSYKIYKYEIDNHIINTSLINKDNFYNEFDMLYGSRINNLYDVVLILDSNNNINKYDMSIIGLTNDNYTYDSLNNYVFYIGEQPYTIKGIIRSKKDSVLNELSGILYNSDAFINNIPSEIDLYPINYDNKQVVIDKLNEYKNVKYQDLSTSFKNISNNLIDGISIVLIVFSITTLIVSSILISILTYINISEYKHEIGIYKSLGISNLNIQLIFYLENLIITGISIISSILVLFILSIPLNNMILNITGLSNVISIKIVNIFIIFILSIILSLLSSFIPINNISKLSIVEILRNE